VLGCQCRFSDPRWGVSGKRYFDAEAAFGWVVRGELTPNEARAVSSALLELAGIAVRTVPDPDPDSDSPGVVVADV